MKTKIIHQFVNASLIQLMALISISIAKADEPTPPRSYVPIDVSTLPGPSRRPPMVDVSAGVEHVIGGGPRVIIGVNFGGISRNGENLPLVGTHFFAVDAELGIGTDGVGGENLSRIKIEVVPIRFAEGPDLEERDANVALAASFLRTRFERETSIGVRESIEVFAFSFDFETGLPYRADELERRYPIAQIAIDFFGYAYRNFDYSLAALSVGPNQLRIVNIDARAGVGRRLGANPRLTFEWTVNGRITPGMSGGSEERTGLDLQTEASTDLRIRLSDESGYTRVLGYVRGQVRHRRHSFDDIPGGGAPRPAPITRTAASILAGIELSF